MSLMFHQRFRQQQGVLLDGLSLICKWQVLWEFLAILLELGGKQVPLAPIERFIEGVYRLNWILEPFRFGRVLVDRLDFQSVRSYLSTRGRTGFTEAEACEVSFSALDRQVGYLDLEGDGDLHLLYQRVNLLASRMDLELKLTPIEEFGERVSRTEKELEVLASRLDELAPDDPKRQKLDQRMLNLKDRLAVWGEGRVSDWEKRDLVKRVRSVLEAQLIEMSGDLVAAAELDAVKVVAQNVFGEERDLTGADPAIFPAFFALEKLRVQGSSRRYLIRLVEDRLAGEDHLWLRTEGPALEWCNRMTEAVPGIDLDSWRAPYRKEFHYAPKDAARERRKRIAQDLSQTRKLFKELGKEVADNSTRDDLETLLDGLIEPRRRLEQAEDQDQPDQPPPDLPQEVLEEIAANLQRIRRNEETPDSDYEGTIFLEVETDPFQYLFMGEYGFASCLSMRGPYFWSAVSNAIDIDKAIVWAREPGGNIVGRRLIALTERGIISFRTYANQAGLALDRFFNQFIEAYASHCGTVYTRGRRQSPLGPLLADAWYDDGTV
jgi:hypothetical protein